MALTSLKSALGGGSSNILSSTRGQIDADNQTRLDLEASKKREDDTGIARMLGYGSVDEYYANQVSPGAPVRSKYISNLDNSTGLLKGPLELQKQGDLSWGPDVTWGQNVDWGPDISMDKAALNTEGLNAIRSRALGTGDSPWASLAKSNLAQDSRFNRDALDRQGASENAQAQSELAMRGGLSGGAAERLAMNSSRNIAMRRQQANQAQMQGRMGIGMQDAQQRDAMLTALPGMELGKSNFDFGQNKAASDLAFNNRGASTNLQMQNKTGDLALQMQNKEAQKKIDEANRSAEYARQQYNINNAIQDTQGQNMNNLGAYQEQMKSWAANKQADATAQAAKDSAGSWVCTAVDAATSGATNKRLLGQFLRHCLKTHRDVTRFYLKRCSPVVERMSEAGVQWTDQKWLTDSIETLMSAGQSEAAYHLYKETLMDWIEKFWGDCRDGTYRLLKFEREARSLRPGFVSNL